MANWLSNVANSIFAPFSAGVLTPTYGMSCLPGRIPTNTTEIVSFTGVSTKWLTSSPILSNSGVASVTNGSVTVVDDTHFTVNVTTGSPRGTLTWTDARYGITATQTIGRRSNAGEIVSIYRRRWRR